MGLAMLKAISSEYSCMTMTTSFLMLINPRRLAVAYACLIQRSASGIEAFFPYISMPTRCTRAVRQITPTIVVTPIATDNAICQSGGVCETMRTIMTIGEKKGNNDPQNANDEFGLRITTNER